MIKRLLVIFLLVPVVLLAQTNPRLQWDQSASTVTEATSYQYELWINGVGQLPLRTAKCSGTTSPFVCTDANPLPNQPEGIRNVQLLAIGPQGIKSSLSVNFPITFPSTPSNLRLTP